MTRLDALEAEADRRRQDFATSLRKFKPRLTPLGLADEALRRLDPQAEAVAAASRALRRNPLSALPLLLSLGWLILEAKKKARTITKPPKIKRKEKHLIAVKEKERT